MAHTPGPWFSTDEGRYISAKGTDHPIAIGKLVGLRDERFANASLIVLAPELLRLCKKALTTSARVHPDFERELSSVINQAEGK